MITLKSTTLFAIVFFALLMVAGQAQPNNPEIEKALEQLQSNPSYTLEIQGQDQAGYYRGRYFYSPDFRVLVKEDGSTYLFDQAKRLDKVMVTRNGVAHRYALNNPLLPAIFPDSILKRMLLQASKEPVEMTWDENGQLSALKVGDGSSRLEATSIQFGPDLADPKNAIFLRIRKRN